MTIKLNYYKATILQLVIPLFLLWLLRLAFAYYNLQTLESPTFSGILLLSCYGLRFDLSVWALLNSLFILLRFLPFDFVNGRKYIFVTNWIFLITNTLMLLPAVADIPFFQFNGAHLRWQSVATIWADSNIHGIILSFAKDYWWAFISAIFLIALLAFTAFKIKVEPLSVKNLTKRKRYILRSGIFLLVCGLTFICIRGRIGPGRPLSTADGVWGTAKASEVNIVLNTPFCIIHTMNKDTKIEPVNFFTEEELANIRTSLRKPEAPITSSKKNIMVITIESGSPIWVKSLSPIGDDNAHSLMPFLDSIAEKSVVFPHAFTTGIRSIEGITGIFGGIPTFGDMILMASPYFANSFDSPAMLLKSHGYSTRFYFGGNHSSFNIDQTLKAFGFDKIMTREEYGNDRDFDGEWGIWDHKMGEFAALDLSTLKEPFFAGWFTLNPHGPFQVPSDWQTDNYKSSDAMMKTVEYEDRALRHFFEEAKKQPWYNNTIFIIIGDHGCRDLKGTIYDSSGILPHIILMVFTPDGELQPERIEDKCVSQIDIPATILALANYQKDFISLGENIFSPLHSGYSIMYIHGAYQICGPKYAVRLSADLKRIEGVYDITKDYGLTQRLKNYSKEEVSKMTARARAFMQDYTNRLNQNKLSLTSQKNTAN